MIGRGVGTVTDAGAGLVRAHLPGASIGDGVEIAAGRSPIRGFVRAIENGMSAIVTHGSTDGIVAGDAIAIAPAALTLPLGMHALGRAFDASGAPLDDRGALDGMRARFDAAAPTPDERTPVTVPFWTGVKVIDGLLTIGRGARIGLFGAPGAGKSTLLSLLARGAGADATVIGLCGERGREAAEWIGRHDARTTVICATSDRSAPERLAAAKAAVAQAHVLRSRGLHVLLILDSLARFAAAARELAVGGGEPAGRGGFPASVFFELARLVEVAGGTRRGSVTLVATVLSDGADERDPVSDAARSLLDGHIALSPALAHAGRFPAVDVLASASRTMGAVTGTAHRAAAARVRSALDLLARTADARSLGLPVADPRIMAVQAAEPRIDAFMRQGEISIKPGPMLDELLALADILEEPLWTSQPI